jgi:hypothetical protein
MTVVLLNAGGGSLAGGVAVCSRHRHLAWGNPSRDPGFRNGHNSCHERAWRAATLGPRALSHRPRGLLHLDPSPLLPGLAQDPPLLSLERARLLPLLACEVTVGWSPVCLRCGESLCPPHTWLWERPGLVSLALGPVVATSRKARKCFPGCHPRGRRGQGLCQHS